MTLFDNILGFIINTFRVFANFIIDNILDPLLNEILRHFPDISGYMSQVIDYINNYFFKGIIFAKSCFLNMTGYPSALLILLIIFFAYKFIIMVAMFSLKYILNGYSLFRSGRSAYRSFGGKSK